MKNKEEIKSFDQVIDKIFEEEDVKHHFFENDQMLYAAVDYSGKFKYLSKSWSKCLGFSLEEIKSIPFSVFLHPDDIAESIDAYNFFKKKKRSATKMCVNRYRKIDGSYANLQWFKPVYSKKSKYWMFTAFEIPEGHKGITIYNEGYKPFDWKSS